MIASAPIVVSLNLILPIGAPVVATVRMAIENRHPGPGVPPAD
jgi:hypothetical protein